MLLVNYVERADGSIGTTHAKVKNLSVSDTHDAYTDGNYYVIQIGEHLHLIVIISYNRIVILPCICYIILSSVELILKIHKVFICL